MQQNTVLALASCLEEGQLERVRNLGLHVEPDQGGVCQAGLGEVHQHLGKRSGEQDCLSRIRGNRKPCSDAVIHTWCREVWQESL